jgi:outer membrane protein assembly factor BamB
MKSAGNSWWALALAMSFLQAKAGDWPQWRGPNRTGHASANATELSSLPKELKAVWKLSIGGGFSSPVIAGGKLAYLDEKDGQEVAHLLDAATGKEIRSVPYAEAFRDEWGTGPRSTPILDGDRLYAQSCKGEFRCLNLADGKVLWRTSFEKDWGVKFLGGTANEGTASRRGNNGSGVIEGDRIILPVGSESGASLVCFDKLTGKVLWKTGHDEAAYSSFMVATLAGVKQVVAFTADALLGANLDDGKILWRVALRSDAKRHAVTPVVFGDTVIVSSWTFGQVALRISKEGDGLKAAQAWANKSSKINLSSPVLIGHCLYSQGPGRDYVGIDATTGKVCWSQPGFTAQARREYSSTIAAGEKLLVLAETGTLVLLRANPEKYIELGRAQVCGNTWCHPAFADGKLYVRDGRSLACFDLSGAP